MDVSMLLGNSLSSLFLFWFSQCSPLRPTLYVMAQEGIDFLGHHQSKQAFARAKGRISFEGGLIHSIGKYPIAWSSFAEEFYPPSVKHQLQLICWVQRSHVTRSFFTNSRRNSSFCFSVIVSLITLGASIHLEHSPELEVTILSGTRRISAECRSSTFHSWPFCPMFQQVFQLPQSVYPIKCSSILSS